MRRSLIAPDLKVSELFLAHAIKTREDWEKLFDQASDELEIQKKIVLDTVRDN